MKSPRVGPCLFALAALAGLPAAARSLPKGDATPPVRACPEMGEGFVRLAGSDTCVKLAGSVRIEVMRQGGGTMLAPER